jgi:hypothetical protein
MIWSWQSQAPYRDRAEVTNNETPFYYSVMNCVKSLDGFSLLHLRRSHVEKQPQKCLVSTNSHIVYTQKSNRDDNLCLCLGNSVVCVRSQLKSKLKKNYRTEMGIYWTLIECNSITAEKQIRKIIRKRHVPVLCCAETEKAQITTKIWAELRYFLKRKRLK